MASSKLPLVPFFILSLLLFSTLSNACIPCMPKPPPTPKPKPLPPLAPKPKPPPPLAPKPKPLPPLAPKTKPPPLAPPTGPSCPKDTLKLGVCLDLLGGLLNPVIGTPPSSKCCALLEGLADLEAAVCLCTAIKANVLGINLDVPVTLSVLLSACEKSVPPGFKCE